MKVGVYGGNKLLEGFAEYLLWHDATAHSVTLAAEKHYFATASGQTLKVEFEHCLLDQV